MTKLESAWRLFCHPLRWSAQTRSNAVPEWFQWSAGWLILFCTSSLETKWYRLIPGSILRWRALILHASALMIAEHSKMYKNIGSIQMLYSFILVNSEILDCQSYCPLDFLSAWSSSSLWLKPNCKAVVTFDYVVFVIVKCAYCHRRGLLVECSDNNCVSTFHVTCGHAVGAKFEIRKSPCGVRVTCSRHKLRSCPSVSIWTCSFLFCLFNWMVQLFVSI